MNRVEHAPAQGNSRLAPAVRLPGGDSVSDVLKDCAQLGLLGELRAALGLDRNDGASVQAVRDLVYELAGSKDRDLAVDVLIHATGIAEFDRLTLRDYARKHGLSHEGFRKQVLAMRQRLNLPRQPTHASDAN